jgi:hypothetical protein
MELVGITALINTFGDGDKTWKDRIKAGMPVKVRAQKRGVSHIFDSVDVIKWLLKRNGDEDINPSVEKALLDRARRRLVDLEYESKNALLIPASTVETVWGGMTSAARSRLLALPYRLAMSAMEADGNFAMVETAANELIYEALNELHSYNPRDYGPWK